MNMLDPWLDARQIAQRLAYPDSELIAVLGAEAWCAKCRQLRPLFVNRAAAEHSPRVVWLWLDIEEHTDFIDGFIPDDLPLLLHYRNAQLLRAGVWRASSPENTDEGGLFEPTHHSPLPPLWQRLSAEDWAS